MMRKQRDRAGKWAGPQHSRPVLSTGSVAKEDSGGMTGIRRPKSHRHSPTPHANVDLDGILDPTGQQSHVGTVGRARWDWVMRDPEELLLSCIGVLVQL